MLRVSWVCRATRDARRCSDADESGWAPRIASRICEKSCDDSLIRPPRQASYPIVNIGILWEKLWKSFAGDRDRSPSAFFQPRDDRIGEIVRAGASTEIARDLLRIGFGEHGVVSVLDFLADRFFVHVIEH